MCRLTRHEHLPLQLSGQPQHTEHDAQHYEPPEDGGHPVIQLTAEAPPCPEKERQQTDEGHRRKLFPAGLLEHCSCPDKLEEIPEQKGGTDALPASPGGSDGGVTEASAARSTKAAAASTLLSRTARTEPVCPAPKMARPSSAAATLSVSVWAENVCFAAFRNPSFARW